MKFKRVLILLAVMCLWGGTMIFADSAGQRVRVIINGTELQDGGVLTDGQTMLPLRQVAEAMQSLVAYDADSKKVTVNKPNVHMFLFQDQKIFGKVDQGARLPFSVFAQVDNLRMEISAVKLAVADPRGEEEIIQSQKIAEQKDNFWFRTKEINYSFSSRGNYMVRFYVKPGSSDEWKLVSEKTILSE